MCALCLDGGSLVVVFSILNGFNRCLQYRPLINRVAEVHNTVVANVIV